MQLLQQAHPGMGSIPLERGVAFRVWAPHCQSVAVIGTFNAWDADKHPLQPEDNGYWYVEIEDARVGDEYRFLLKNGDKELSRIDPYAREVTGSGGNAVVHDCTFDWGSNPEFSLPPSNELVIYELHIGTFVDDEQDGSGDFSTASQRLNHLKKIGINCVEIMPIAEFPGDRSWGYNPSHIFAVEGSYGGSKGLKKFIKNAIPWASASF